MKGVNTWIAVFQIGGFMELTHIIEEPYEITSGGRKCIAFIANDNKEYTLVTGAKAIGIDRSTLGNRLQRHHWNTPRLLCKDFYKRKRGRPAKRQQEDLSHIPDGDLAWMNEKPYIKQRSDAIKSIDDTDAKEIP